MPNKAYSAFTFELKEADKSSGRIVGVASRYGVEDSYGDVIEKGAFTKTIKERDFPVLWQHRADSVIGLGSMVEQGNDLILKADLDMDDDVAVKAFGKVEKGLIRGLSIGFQTVKATFEEIKDGAAKRWVRHIQELKLFEVSIVTFPALSEAQITSTKHDQEQALAAQKDTPPEPSAATEPPTGATEPDQEIHSWIEAGIARLKPLSHDSGR